jgi:hypothetical protein
MLLRTSTISAPWTIVEGNDKLWARVKALRTLVELLSKELDYGPVDPVKLEAEKKGKKKEKTKK